MKAVRRPSRDALYGLAQGQAGHFTTAQAHEAGYSLPLLHKYLATGRVTRIRHGVYRLVHFPSTENEALVVLWLWAQKLAVFSHETALALHDLADVLPSVTHMTLPSSWRKRRLRVPEGAILHFKNIDERDWIDAIPITSPYQSIRDSIDTYLAPDLLSQAISQASTRGLISGTERSSLLLDLATSQENPQ